MSEGTQRRLAAIVAIDVVGYSRLMGADEDGTLAVLKGHREATIPIGQAHGGRVVSTSGDGALWEFPSVTEAVTSAIEVQALMATRNADIPDDRKMLYRIGINLGDVMVDGDDIYGDGINIAARIESLANPGGVSISDDAYRQVRDRLDINWEDSGEHEVKNIARPIQVWRWSPNSETPTKPVQAQSSNQDNLQQLLDQMRPLSIAVLPFNNMSSNEDIGFFCDGLSESLITDLSKDTRYTVASRNASFVYKGQSVVPEEAAKAIGVEYLIEGSVQAMGARMRINAQLIDGRTGEHLAAERYDHGMDDLFVAQDKICKYITFDFNAALIEGDALNTEQRDNIDPEAYRLLHEANARFFKFSSVNAMHCIKLADRALEIDPEFARAWSTAASFRAMTAFFSGPVPGIEYLVEEAQPLADRANALAPESGSADYAQAYIYLAQDRFDEALEYAIKSVEKEPGLRTRRAVLVGMFLWAGRLDAAISEGFQMFRGARFVIRNACTNFATACLLSDRPQDALAIMQMSSRLYGTPNFYIKTIRATAYKACGHDEEADTLIQEVFAEVPAVDLSYYTYAYRFKDQALVTKMKDLLIATGVPDFRNS